MCVINYLPNIRVRMHIDQSYADSVRMLINAFEVEFASPHQPMCTVSNVWRQLRAANAFSYFVAHRTLDTYRFLKKRSRSPMGCCRTKSTSRYHPRSLRLRTQHTPYRVRKGETPPPRGGEQDECFAIDARPTQCSTHRESTVGTCVLTGAQPPLVHSQTRTRFTRCHIVKRLKHGSRSTSKTVSTCRLA